MLVPQIPVRLLKQTKLFYQQGTSDKVYEVDLCEAGEGEFVVNFRYGRRGTRLREGTKTPFPESRSRAESIFNELVQSKKARGYLEAGESAPVAAEPGPSTRDTGLSAVSNPRIAKVQSYLQNTANGNAPSDWSLSRLIWRVGEMRIEGSVDQLLLVDGEGEMGDYSLAWSLGRLGKRDGGSKLRDLYATGTEKVKRMAAEALVACLEGSERAELFSEMRRKLSPALQEALDSPAGLKEALREQLTNGAPPHDDLYRLYFLGAGDPSIRELVYETVLSLPLRAPFFRPIRYIFKAAEFRLDAEFYGMLAKRFEKEQEAFNNDWNHYWDPEKRESIRTDQELKKPNSRIAYSNRTRAYMRRRVVRTLRRAGEIDDVATYIPLATGTLMAFRDVEDAGEPFAQQQYAWNRQSRNYDITQIHFDTYCRYQAFNYILYANSTRYQMRLMKNWVCTNGYVPGQPAPAAREEAFPKLWDKAPDALMHLLSYSEAERVHEFAAKVWKANPRFKEMANPDFVLRLLSKPYLVSQQLGLDLARELFDPANPDRTLIVAVLSSSLTEAHDLGISWLRADERLVLGDPDFAAEIFLIPQTALHTKLRELLSGRALSPDFLRAFVPKVVTGLLELEPEDETANETARHVRETLLILAGGTLGEIGLNVVRDLVGSPLTELQMLGGQALLQRTGDSDEIPDDIFFALLSADTESVRGIGMQLFGRLSDTALMDRSEILASLCISEKDDMRVAARPIMQRLAGISPGFAQDMVLQFYPMLMRQEPYEGLHDDVYVLLEGPLGEHLHVIPQESCFRMLQSRYRGGQLLGLLILKRFVGLDGQPMKRLVMIADNEPVEGREYVWDYFQQNVDVVRASKEEALRMLDSEWEDTREFSLQYFRTAFVEEDWTPELLVSICDSVRGEVQDFGRELITRFFKTEDGPEYLLKLSQHPTLELQMFASNYLERFASDDIEKLRALEEYFLAVLTQVNRGRVAKARVLRHLEREALKSAEAGEFVMSILNRQSVTMAIQDKASIIKTMVQIRKRWPELETPLQPKSFPTAAVE